MSVLKVMAALDGLSRHERGAAGAEQVVQDLCATALASLGVDGAAVMISANGRSRFVWAEPARISALGERQEVLQAGPCRDAIDTTATVSASTPAEIDRRWALFGAAARTCGVGSLVVVPLVSSGRCWGTLDLFWNDAHEASADVVLAAQVLAHIAVAHLAAATDRDDAEDVHTDLRNQVLHDQLTGLPNRGLIHELLIHSLQVAHRRGSSVAVLFLDLDGFKQVNDSRGHSTGDIVLRETASRLRATVRGSDTVGRLSGDEFLIVCEDLPATPDEIADVTSILADRIRAAVALPITIGGSSVTVTASVGVAIAAADPTSAADLIHEADIAMYEAKALGPGGTVTHKTPAQTDLNRRRRVERELFEALRRNEFEVFYQPIYSAAAMVAVEALVRWHHPVDGLLAAGEFIEIAESTGVIVPMGHWVIRQALTQLRRWHDEMPDTAPHMVWCNLGPRELVAPDLKEHIDRTLTSLHLGPQHLGIEVVEGHLADPRLAGILAALHRSGHPLAIDDFGIGYSSLSRLVDMPFSHLKIDRSLVSGLPDSRRARTLIRAVLTIARELEITVVSEGVETAAQAAYLTAAGSQLFQGYHFERPASAARISELMTRRPTSLPVPRGPRQSVTPGQ